MAKLTEQEEQEYERHLRLASHYFDLAQEADENGLSEEKHYYETEYAKHDIEATAILWHLN